MKAQIRFSREKINSMFRDAVLSMRPNKDGTCRKEKCGGLVVKDIIGFAGVYVYSIPYCNKCKATHMVQKWKDVPISNLQEFNA